MSTKTAEEMLTIEKIQRCKALLKQEREIAGFVFRIDLEPVVNNYLKRRQQGGLFDRYGVKVYFDEHQDEPCLVFYDEWLLRAYLNRHRLPMDYANETMISSVRGTGGQKEV